jgi:hypothetical protein
MGYGLEKAKIYYNFANLWNLLEGGESINNKEQTLRTILNSF